MIRFIPLLLALELSVAHSADPVPPAITRYDSPIQLDATSGYVGQIPDVDWAQPMLAKNAMKLWEFTAWKEHWSEGFFAKTKINEARFQEICAKPLPMDDVTFSFFAEARLSFEGEKYLLVYGCAFPRTKYPTTEKELNAMVSTDFFRSVDGRWIIWSMPHDMGFKSPLIDLLDYQEVLGFK